MKTIAEEKPKDEKPEPVVEEKKNGDSLKKPEISDQEDLKSAQNSKKRVEVTCEYKKYEDLRELTDPNFCPEVDSPQHKD